MTSKVLRMGSERLHHHGPDGEIGHEMPVHDVNVDESAPAETAAYLFAQAGEIRRQDQRRDADSLPIG